MMMHEMRSSRDERPDWVTGRAVEQIKYRLAARQSIVDVSHWRKMREHEDELREFGGYIISRRGRGKLIAVKPETLRDWISCASADCRRVIQQLKREHIMVFGADGKTTRLVEIGDLRPQRYFCFKLPLEVPVKATVKVESIRDGSDGDEALWDADDDEPPRRHRRKNASYNPINWRD